MILFKQMIVLFLIMLIGYVLAKKGVITDETSKSLSYIVVNVANPALIISGGMGAKISFQIFFQIFFLAIAIFATMILLAYLYTMIFRTKQENKGIYRCMMIFSNIGFMGFPIVQALYSEEALIYASIFLMPFNILIYTFGIRQMSGGTEKSFSLKKVINMGTIAGVCALIITIGQIPIPDIIGKTVSYLSNLTSPLSMIVIGASCSKINGKELVKDLKLDLFLLFKMFFIPIAGISILKLCGIQDMLLGVCMIMIAAPVGSMNAMLVQQYGGDENTVTKGVILSTLISVVSMPLVSMLL